jgi:hypothetical protein
VYREKVLITIKRKITQKTSVFCNIACSPGTPRPAVAQSLATVIDYKIFLPPASANVDALTVDDLLPTSIPTAQIMMPSRFSPPTGYGSRALSPKELFLAWDIPLWAIPASSRRNELHHLPPLKALLSQADALVSALSLPARLLGSAPLAPIPVPLLSTRTWLAHPDDALHTVKGVWLPHAWMDDSVLSAKAAKADKAALPLHLWTRRIALALETPTRSLPALWDWQFGRVCRTLVRDFCAYMRSKHPRMEQLRLVDRWSTVRGGQQPHAGLLGVRQRFAGRVRCIGTIL